MTPPRKLSPLHIQILLHSYVSPEPFPFQNDTVSEYHRHLDADGLIRRKASTAVVYQEPPEPVRWECTPKGRAHIEQISTLPYPTQAWVSASGSLISTEPS